MSTIVVCCKWALDIANLPAGFPAKAEPEDWQRKRISEFDLQALRQGSRLRTETGWELVAVTCGSGVTDSLRDILSRGPDSISYVADSVLDKADSRTIAKVLAALIRELPDVKVVICGEGSSDRGSQQIGPRLAVLLGYTCLTYATRIKVQDDLLEVVRSLQGEEEIVQVHSPLVLSISGGLTQPDLPGIRAIMEAGQKPARAYDLEQLGFAPNRLEAEKLKVELVCYTQQRRGIRVDCTNKSPQETALKLLEILDKEGALAQGGG